MVDYRIRIIKDHDKVKSGDILVANKRIADIYVKNGIAEYVDKPGTMFESKGPFSRNIRKERFTNTYNLT